MSDLLRLDATLARAARLDNFVDAAFAFAVTLLLISGDPPASVDGLMAALGRAPAFAAGFALIGMFWLAHRDYSHFAAKRGGWSTFLSLSIVFVVLLYVLPLRVLADSSLYWISGRRIGAAVVIDNVSMLASLYTAYAAGFVALTLLYVLLFHQVGRPGMAIDDSAKQESSKWKSIFVLMTTAGLVSMVLAQWGPMRRAPWLPGVAYVTIPIGIGWLSWGWAANEKRRRRA